MKTTNIPFQERLQVRINLVLIPLILVILGVFTVYSYVSTRDKMEKELSTVSSISADRLARSLAEPFWSLDDDMLRESIKSEMMDERVMAVNIHDKNNKVYLAFSRDGKGAIEERRIPLHANTIKAANPIQRKQEKLGSVEVYYTTNFINYAIRLSMVKLAVTTLILIVVVSLATNIVVRKIVITPINQLTNVASEISVGNLELQFQNKSNDEIGALMNAIERMRYSLVIAIKQLKDLKASKA